MWLGASDGIVERLDAIDGTSPRGVDILRRIDTDGVGGTGEGGRGTNNGNACGVLSAIELRTIEYNAYRGWPLRGLWEPNGYS